MIDYSRNIPKVSFENKELESYMIDFMMENLTDAVRINSYIGLVMIRLGFRTEDKIEFRNFNRDKKEDYFQCIVNGKDYYGISFSNVGNKKKHTKITLVYFNEEITYECFSLSLSELGVRIIPVRECIKYADGVSYIREYSRENAKYIVEYFDNCFELEVVKPKDLELPMYDRNGNYSRYRVNNEDMLVKYLSDYFSMWKDKDIVKVYKNICEISLGNDLSKYGEVSLKSLYDGEVTDLIWLKNGELKRFGMTLPNMGRRLFLNKDGSWNYGITDKNDLFSYSMNVNGDRINYNIDLNENVSSDVVSEIIKRDTEDAKNGIDNVKRLVRKIFNNNGEGSN